jgi:polyisoprenoid-binding protein YceI
MSMNVSEHKLDVRLDLSDNWLKLPDRPVTFANGRGRVLQVKKGNERLRMKSAILCLLASCLLSSISQAQVPVFQIDHATSSVKFNVSASVPISGTFDKWDATLTFTSPELATGVLDIKIQADSVNTGSGVKDGKLKSKDFFDAKEDPYITFHSTKVTQTGPTTVEFEGDFTIRGVKKNEKLTFTITGKGTGSGAITGTMAFDRKEFGMNSGIPFIKIADRVEVSVDLKGKRVSGPPVVMKE